MTTAASSKVFQMLAEELKDFLKTTVDAETVERILDVLADVLYGTMFTNYFSGRSRSPAEQARDILDIAFYGILSESERGSRRQQRESGREL